MLLETFTGQWIGEKMECQDIMRPAENRKLFASLVGQISGIVDWLRGTNVIAATAVHPHAWVLL